MCRIAGFRDFNYQKDYNFENILINMRDILSYGGLDDSGVYMKKDRGLAMAHRRLFHY